jgi:hypothetical protein
MSRSIKTAWGEEENSAKVKNAYHNIKEDDVIVNLQGQIIGIASNMKACCTATSPGSVHLLNDKKENTWVSGDVIDIGNNTWVITNNTIVK